jgi:hypothetical protein
VIYHESHDEAGNAPGSGRTIAVAVHRAPLVDETRRFAEARVRFAAGMTLLAPGTPMFFMGEEVGASLDYRYDDFTAGRETREDYMALRAGAGAQLFAFYADVIRLRLAHAALRSRNIDVVEVHDANRVIAFRRWAVRLPIREPSHRRRPMARGVQLRRAWLWRRRCAEPRADRGEQRDHRGGARQLRGRPATNLSRLRTGANMSKSVLVILSEYGFWGEELIGPLESFDNAGYEVRFATPRGQRRPGWTVR